MKPPIKPPIFLDNQSTTPLDPDVFEVMTPFFLEQYGNASSRSHCFGWDALEAVEAARFQVARIINSDINEIIFTSGATESLNLALQGLAKRNGYSGHLITTAVEHKASLSVCEDLEKQGVKVTYLPVNKHGSVSAEQVANAIQGDTFLVNLIFANNEIGTLNPISEIGKLCAEKKVVFHTDGSQAIGKVSVDVKAMNIGMLSMSAHKIYGPKGCGALFVSRQNPRVRIDPLIRGGGQEGGLRGGTLNVPGIVGFGSATELARQKRIPDATHMSELKNVFLKTLEADLNEVLHINGHPFDGIPNNLSLTFAGAPSRSVLAQVHTKIALSTGSSCSSETGEVSHVLKAIGLNEEQARSTLRIGFGRFNTLSQIETAAHLLAAAVKNARRQQYNPPLENAALSS